MTCNDMVRMDRLQTLAVHYDVLDLSNVILKDERFPLWAGASQPHLHHYRRGGLLEHVTEVVELSLANNNYFQGEKRSDERLLFLAALFHDAGKMWDYEPVPVEEQWNNATKYSTPHELYKHWKGTQHRRRIHHISRSAQVWGEAARNAKSISQEQSDDVLHAILSHHGLREWGSPVAPNTRLAWILHLSDSISARVDDCDRHELHKS